MQKLHKSARTPRDGRTRRLQKLEKHGQEIKKRYRGNDIYKLELKQARNSC